MLRSDLNTLYSEDFKISLVICLSECIVRVVDAPTRASPRAIIPRNNNHEVGKLHSYIARMCLTYTAASWAAVDGHYRQSQNMIRHISTVCGIDYKLEG
jgi:hypothetical protein